MCVVVVVVVVVVFVFVFVFVFFCYFLRNLQRLRRNNYYVRVDMYRYGSPPNTTRRQWSPNLDANPFS
jgi:hypothetical protein